MCEACERNNSNQDSNYHIESVPFGDTYITIHGCMTHAYKAKEIVEQLQRMIDVGVNFFDLEEVIRTMTVDRVKGVKP